MSLEETLRALQCHFTWDLESSRNQLLVLRDKLEDVGPEEGYRWLGHIYNLQGFVHFQLGSEGDARRCLGQAAEAFRQIRNTVSDEGPWLVVNYGNLAWLHLLLGETKQSQAYVAQVDVLLEEYPSPSQDELHPEILAEKAWTLMKFGFHKKLLAAEYFQKAIRMQPNMVEWNTSQVLALDSAFQICTPEEEGDIAEQMRTALENDPENLYLAALHLEKRAERGEKIVDEARDLARRVLNKTVSSYSGIKPLLKLYRMYVSMDEAIDLAEEALERHPNNRFLKSCVATCYKWKIFWDKDNLLRQSMIDRAIGLLKDVISLYSHSSVEMKIALANTYAQSNHHLDRADADQTYNRLLESHLDPEQSQRLYNCYAKYLNFYRQDSQQSIRYHMKAAEIPEPSNYRKNSIAILERIKERNRNSMCGEIKTFLENLQGSKISSQSSQSVQ